MIDFPIIDSHIHLLDRKRFDYSWSTGSSWATGSTRLNRDWTAEDLASYAKPYEVEGFVFVEADVDMPQHADEAKWVNTLGTRDKRIKACVACLPLENGPVIESELVALAALPLVRGVRRLIQNQPDPEYVLHKPFLDALRLLPKYGLLFEICIMHHQFPNTIEMVRRCPEVSFVLDHIGKPSISLNLIEPWRQHIRDLAALPNVACKLSGVLTEANHKTWTRDSVRPYIDHTIECFGADRIMFGGDWPVLELAATYRDWVDVADWATQRTTREEKRKIFRENATRTYRLEM